MHVAGGHRIFIEFFIEFLSNFLPNLTASKLNFKIGKLSNYSRIYFKLLIRRTFLGKFAELNSHVALGDMLGDHFDEFSEASDELVSWIEELKETMNCKNEFEFSVEKFMRSNKDTMAKCLLTVCKTVEAYQASFKSAKGQVENLKSELIESQRTVVKLQQDLLDVKSEEIKSMSTVVDTAVQKGIQTYSEVTQSLTTSAPGFTAEKLKKVVQEAVADEDRSRNIVVFGMEEKTDEDLDSKITAIFEELSEKPSFQATRVGKESDNKIRPVKVSLRSSDTVHQILVKAKQLRSTNTYRSVYIAPDRTPEERIKQRKLISEMKRLASEDSRKHYYVKSGRILSTDIG